MEATDNDKKIALVVDSESSWRNRIKDCLSSEFQVTVAGNYSEALDYYLKQVPNYPVVITEIALDENDPNNQDGFQLADEINKSGKNTKVVILTRRPTISGARIAFKEKKLYEYIEKEPPDGKNFDEIEFCIICKNALKEAENARNIFVVMPFAGDYDIIYGYIQEVAQKIDKVCKRADQRISPNTGDDIMQDIHSGIKNAEVVVAELSDVKPNVLFEIGMSYAWQKKVILIARKSEEKKIPEILSRYRIIFYSEKLGGEKALKNELIERLKEEFSSDNVRKIFPDIDSSLCFVITSPNDDGRDTYEAIIKKSIDEVGLKTSLYVWNDVGWDKFGFEIGKLALIEKKLREACFVVSDLTWDDPTAFYLSGIVYGLNKKYKFLYRQDQKPPFDIRHLYLLRHSKNSEFERKEAGKVLTDWLRFVSEGNFLLSILFFAAEPSDQVRLWLGREFREIKDEISRSLEKDHFILELPELSSRSKDITRALLETKAEIVHFSGHGSSGGQLFFETDDGKALPIEPEILASLFKHFSEKIKCVVLNACYSEKQAKALSHHIDYVIGMTRGISDKAAIAFSIGFYQALGAGRSIEEAFEMGKIQSGLQSAPEYQTPILLKRSQ